jgi:predicted aspartyl protease
MCKGLINNIATDMLIDTGSVYTLISYHLFKDIATTNQSKLFASPCKSTVVSANTDKNDIHGVSDVNIFINGVKCCHSVLIAKQLAHHCLLGTDFLRKHNAKIDFQKNGNYRG